MQLEAHPDCRSHHLLQEVQVSKHPLVFCGDAEVAFKQGVETVEKWFQTLLWEEEDGGGERRDKEREREVIKLLQSHLSVVTGSCLIYVDG